jgi:predicted ester cyclase
VTLPCHSVAMSDERPRELAERLFAAIDTKDHATIESLCADQRLREALGRFLTTFPDLRFRPDWIISENDMVAAWVEIEGTHDGPFRGVAPTGKHVQSAAIYALRVQDGKFVDYWLGADWLGMLDQMGALRIIDPSK